MKFSLSGSAALLTAAVMLCSAYSCSNSSTDSSSKNNQASGNIPAGANVAEADLPYGAKITQLRPDTDEHIKIHTEFDNRYFERTKDGTYPSVYAVHDYIYAINERDVDIMKEAFYPPLLEKYSKDDGHENIQDYIDSYCDSIKEVLHEDFTFDYIIIDSCDVADPDNLDDDFKELDAELEAVSPGITAKITDRRIVDLDLYYNVNGQNEKSYTNHSGDSLMLYEYQIDGKYYIV